MWTYPNDVIDMNKYPHLSNVLNREFDDVAKNEAEEIVGLKSIVDKLQELITIQTKAAQEKNERMKAEEEKARAIREKEEQEKERQAKEEQAMKDKEKREEVERKKYGGKTKKEKDEEDAEYKRISRAARRRVRTMGGKIPKTNQPSVNDPPKETDEEKAKREARTKFKGLPRAEQKRRRKKALENKINEENQRKTEDEAEAKLAEVERQRQLELEQIQRRRQQKEDEKRRKKEELRNKKNDAKNRKEKFSKSEDDESNWFSAVRV